MESFYGGRQGISFIIVKRFDGIDIPKDTSFTVKYFAFDTSENNFILDENNNPIERTNDTYKLYNDWKLHEKDGSSITYKEKEGVFPFQYAEGMVQCFSQGGITTDIVNYGEYVIIDTPNKNDLDNGKVYRRGLDYQNDLGGAEYIGQIIGPTGSSPEIYMDSFTTLVSEGGPQISYENDDIIPGMELDADGQMIFNDAIHSSWVTLRDQFGVVTGCKIGFQFPYHVFSFTAKNVDDPYTKRELIKRIDDKQHPYFSKWEISIPKGIKGDTFDNLHIANSIAIKDAVYYEDENCTIELGTLSEDTLINFNSGFYNEEREIYTITLESGDIAYVKKEDTDKEVLVYKEIKYDTNPLGDIEYFILGEYNVIDNITLMPDGSLKINYSYDGIKICNEDNKIQWINNIRLTPKGKLEVKYNTADNYVTINDSPQQPPIQWIDKHGIQINTNKIDTNGTDLGEGSGSQKVQVTYNTGEVEEIGQPINYIIESVITKNREELTDDYREKDTGQLKSKVAKNNRLLVIYSDPSLRAQLQADTIWESKKLGYFDQWYDMGEVKGDPGTVKIATTITSSEAETLLIKDNPPENILNDIRYEGWLIGVYDPAFPEKPIILYYYDYDDDKNTWKELGSVLAPEVPVKPENIVQLDTNIAADLSNITLEEKGIFFTKDEDAHIIKDLRQKNDNTISNPYYFSSFAKYITPTLNAGVDTLEQQLLIGFNTITEEWIDELGDIHTKTKFLRNETTPEYYILHSIIYVRTNIVNNIVKKDTLSIYKDNVETNIFQKEISQFINEQGIKITKEKIINLGLSF